MEPARPSTSYRPRWASPLSGQPPDHVTRHSAAQGAKKPWAAFFGAAGTGGRPRMHAWLSHTQRGLRRVLREQHGLRFTLPCCPALEAADRAWLASSSSEVSGLTLHMPLLHGRLLTCSFAPRTASPCHVPRRMAQQPAWLCSGTCRPWQGWHDASQICLTHDGVQWSCRGAGPGGLPAALCGHS